MDKLNKLEKSNKVRVETRINKDLLSECDFRLNKSTFHSRTDYVEAALRFYNQYFDGECPLEFLAPVFATFLDSSFKGFENRISRNIFKVAVELAKLQNMLATVNDLDEDSLRRLHIRCVDEVKRINGLIDFEDAVKYQNS